MTKHVFKRVAEREVTHGVIKTVMRYGKQMYDTKKGTWVFWKDNMINGKGLAVVVNEKRRTIVSVIPMTRKEVNAKLRQGTWVRKSYH